MGVFRRVQSDSNQSKEFIQVRMSLGLKLIRMKLNMKLIFCMWLDIHKCIYLIQSSNMAGRPGLFKLIINIKSAICQD